MYTYIRESTHGLLYNATMISQILNMKLRPTDRKHDSTAVGSFRTIFENQFGSLTIFTHIQYATANRTKLLLHYCQYNDIVVHTLRSSTSADMWFCRRLTRRPRHSRCSSPSAARQQQLPTSETD